MYQAAYAILLASFVPWLIAGSYFSLLVFTLVMGVGHGGLAALYAPVTASMFGIEKLGELLGILFTGFGIGSLIGPPLAAILVDYPQLPVSGVRRGCRRGAGVSSGSPSEKAGDDPNQAVRAATD